MTTKNAYMLERLHVIDPKIPHPTEEGLAILKEIQGSVQSWEKEVHERFADCFVACREIRRDPAGFIICLSYWDITNLVDLEPGGGGGTYIYSSSEAYNEEQRIDAQRLCNWLDHFGFRKVGGLPGAEQGPYHASGHIDGPSLLCKTIAKVGGREECCLRAFRSGSRSGGERRS